MASLQSHHAAHLALVLYLCASFLVAGTGHADLSLRKTKLAHFTYQPGSDGYTCSLQCQSPTRRNCGDGCKVVGSAMRLLPAPPASSRVPAMAAARFMRAEPVQLWDAATGAAASFRTFFVVKMSRQPGTCMADGMAFLLSPGTAVPRKSWGRALGVAEDDDQRHLRGLVRDGQIALRFVTYNKRAPYVALSSWGSHGNAAQSDRIYTFSIPDTARSSLAVWLRYDAHAGSVELKMAVWRNGDEFTAEAVSSLERGARTVFTAPLNLTESAESSSYVGFSAGTGSCTEINELFYWEFQQFKQGLDPQQMPEAPSPSPSANDEDRPRRPVEAPLAADVPTLSPAYAAEEPAPAPAPSLADVVPAPSPKASAEDSEPASAPSMADVGPARSPKASAEKQAPAPFASAVSPVSRPAEVPSWAPSPGHKNDRQQLCDRQICKLLMPLCQMAGHVAPGRAW